MDRDHRRTRTKPPCIVPTGVGMDRARPTRKLMAGDRPHRRGDGPNPCRGHPGEHHRPHRRGDGPRRADAAPPWEPSSPQAWGWTVVGDALQRAHAIVPTGVGMDRATRRLATRARESSPQAWGWTDGRPARQRRRYHRPHRRGDGPSVHPSGTPMSQSSPQAWGWTETRNDDLRAMRHRPHRRGDGPYMRGMSVRVASSSPQAWGWTVPAEAAEEAPSIVPTGVGMDRRSSRRRDGEC